MKAATKGRVLANIKLRDGGSCFSPFVLHPRLASAYLKIKTFSVSGAETSSWSLLTEGMPESLLSERLPIGKFAGRQPPGLL